MAANTAALRQTIRELTDAGRLQDVDAALVTLVRSLAAAVDEDSGNASLWREYRAALAILLEVGAEDEDVDVDFGSAVSAPVRNTKEP